MGRVADFRVLFTSQGKGLGGGVHVSVKNHDGKKPQEAASRPFLLLSYEKDRLEIVERAYENKNREGFIVALTCLSPNFFFLRGGGRPIYRG